MSIPLPRIRTDLIISRQGSGDGLHFVVKDPVNGQFYRLKEAEHFVAEQLDGATSTDAIRRRVEERFGARLEPETLTALLKSFRDLGLLDTGEAVGPRRTGRRNSLLYYRIKAFDPNPLFDRLIGKLRFLFTPAFVVLAALVVCTALFLTVTHWPEIARDLSHLHLLRVLALAWVVVLAVGMAHEFAHGLTCKHFGGEVHEIGFLFLYLQPALYCDVSDAWLIPKKSRRLWVTLAGSFFELFIWGLSTIAWWLTNPGTVPNLLALIVMATSGVKTLLNFNPLLRLDGYYLLSDWLEIPNLRRKSFAYIRGLLQRLVGSARPETVECTPRERRFFLLYGTIAAVYSILVLGFIAARLGPALIGRYQLVGLLLFLVAFGIRARSRVGRLMPRGGASFKPERAARPLIRRPAIVIAVIAAVGVASYFGRLELKIGGEFNVMPIHNADVRAQVDGLVRDVLVREGQAVRRGELIMRLDDRDLDAQRRQVEADLAEKQARLQLLRAGPRAEELALAQDEVQKTFETQQHSQQAFEESKRVRQERIAKARSTLAKSEQSQRYAEGNLERSKKLLDAGVLSRKEYETVEEQASLKQRAVEEDRAELNMILADDLSRLRRDLAITERDAAVADGRLRILEAGSRREEVTEAEAEVARLEAARDHIVEQLGLVIVTSPIDGIVTTPQRQLSEMHGKLLSRGQLVAEVYEMHTLTTEIAVPEDEIADIQVGQPVLVKARALPMRMFRGKVTAIGTTVQHSGAIDGTEPAPTTARPDPGDKLVLVTTQIDNPSMLLKPEMTGKAKILCGKHRVLDLMTRRMARTFRVEFWSWW